MKFEELTLKKVYPIGNKIRKKQQFFMDKLKKKTLGYMQQKAEI